MSICFLDTNILLRYLIGDDEERAERSLNLLLRIQSGEEKVFTSSLVIFETIFTLQKFYKVPRQEIKEKVANIISMRNLQLPDKDVYYREFELYVYPKIFPLRMPIMRLMLY